MKCRKFTMGARIDFPMVMNYKDTEMPIAQAYFYFLNGHNDVVYFSNSTFDDFETYEYSPWGVLLTSSNKNNLLYTAREFDFDTSLQFNRARYYSSNLGRYNVSKNRFLKNKYILSNNLPTNTYSSSSSEGNDFWDCVTSCYDQRYDWEIECYDDYIICMNACYDFEPPEVAGVMGPIKCGLRFPEEIQCNSKEGKEDECKCWEEYQNCLYSEIPGKVTECMDNCKY